MALTIGILGSNGITGSSFVKYLIPHHEAGRVKIVLFNRPGKPPRNIPQHLTIEAREIDLEESNADSLARTVQGINVFVSLIAPQALNVEVKLAEALAKSKDLLYYIPSIFGRPWTQEDKERPEKKKVARFLFAGHDRALQLGVKVTIVECGFFDYSFFQDKLLGADLQANQVHFSKNQLQNPLCFTSTDYLAAAIACLVTQPPDQVAGKTFSAVQFRITGQEIVDVLTKIHNGQPTTITEFTENDLNNLLNDSEGFGSAIAGYREYWEHNSWKYATNIEVTGRPAEEFEAITRRYL